MGKALTTVAALLVLFLMSGCAPGPNELAFTPGGAGDPAGFWMGIWHGFISLFTFIVSLFSDHVNVYEVHNNGAWYNGGFLIGVMLFYGGSGGGAGRKRK